MRNTPV